MSYLTEEFLSHYRKKNVNWGWNGVGAVVFYRTYSRSDNPLARGPKETWAEVCQRCVNFMFNTLEARCISTGSNWNREKAGMDAEEAFDLMYSFMWSPPGRGLWQAGTPFVEERGVTEGLNNCAFISSKFLPQEKGDFFAWIMGMSMLGVGVGFDTRGAGSMMIQKPLDGYVARYTIPDSREGWSKSIELLINSYFDGSATVIFDYNLIRAKGEPIKGFGGTASGPKPLMELHEKIRDILDRRVFEKISATDIVDICNLIGVCVIAGNVRRTALIALGDTSDEFLDLKDYSKNPWRSAWGWTSNNSPLVEQGADYLPIAERAWENGEPGVVWMDNIRNYGRMNGILDYTDAEAMGVNPCGEQALFHREMCNIPETFPSKCATYKEWERALKCAYMYGKAISLLNQEITDSISRDVMTSNMRLGISFSGVTMLISRIGKQNAARWMDRGYAMIRYWDRLYSQWLQVPQAIKVTSQKPSGTLSLMVGTTPGVHYHQADRWHVRRIQIADHSPLLGPLSEAGYHIESSVYSRNTQVVEFPIDGGPYVVPESSVSVFDQIENAAMVQRFWADNAVSVTVKFHQDQMTPQQMSDYMRKYEDKLKTISFLPVDTSAYQQLPYEGITREAYEKMTSKIRPFKIVDAEDEPELYCEGDTCQI